MKQNDYISNVITNVCDVPIWLCTRFKNKLFVTFENLKTSNRVKLLEDNS